MRGQMEDVNEFPYQEMVSHLFPGLSHEFRTPLTLLITGLEQMHADCDCAEQKRKLAMMLRNAQRLFYNFKRMMGVSEIDGKKLQLNTGLYNIIPFLKGIMASFELLAEENKVQLILNAEKEDFFLYLDLEKMSEVMCNLLMNALRYTPAGGQITVSIYRSSPDAVVISVRDMGPGIPRDQLESIFAPYYSLGKSFEHQKKGFGIGLYLVREYLRLHGGEIHVNNSEAKGVEFVIRLPIAKEYFIPGEIVGPPGSVVRETAGNEIAARHAFMLQLEREEALRPPDELTGIETGAQEREIVLVVEDNLDMRRFIAILLREYYTVVEAENGREGISMAKKMIPDIIVSDIIMPEVDGIRLCRELKHDFNTSHIPVILLTARFEKKDIIRGLEAGADDYIIKPFHAEALLARIKNLIGLRRQLQEKIERRLRLQPEAISVSKFENLFLDKIQRLIEKDLSDPNFGVDQLAVALDMSRPTLYRKMLALTGHSPNKFIQAYRLKRSVNLLKSHYGNITEVAYKVGFSSSAYFTKCFKETFHQLPSDFQAD